MSRIGFIGTGHIAAPMVRHLAAKGHEIVVTRRSAEISSTLTVELGNDVAGTAATRNAVGAIETRLNG